MYRTIYVLFLLFIFKKRQSLLLIANKIRYSPLFLLIRLWEFIVERTIILRCPFTCIRTYFVRKRKVDRRILNPWACLQTEVDTTISRYSDRRFRAFRINETLGKKELPGPPNRHLSPSAWHRLSPLSTRPVHSSRFHVRRELGHENISHADE